jgi:3-phosphoglycerate kinase
MEKLPIEVLINLIALSLIISGLIAIFFVIVAGYQLMTSAGNREKVQKAMETLTYAIVGLVITLLSFFIIQLVSILLGAQFSLS